jgi:ribosomal protein S27E
MTTDPPGDHEPEVEIICQYCGYHLVRSAERLRRDIPMVCPNCGKEIVGPEDNNGTWS